MSDLLAAELIRDVPDFPKPGILFKDITPVLGSPQAVQQVVDKFAEFAREHKPDVIVGIESRGFMFGVPLALKLNLGFVPVRKVGKLPSTRITEEYSLEYGTNAVEIHDDSITSGQRVLIVDDLLATGGTAAAAARLIERLGGTVVGFSFLIDLAFLDGREVIKNYDIQSLITFD